MKCDYNCKNCGKEFSRDNCGKNPTFCCLACFTEYKINSRKHYFCKNCGKEFIRHSLDKNKTFCSLKCYKEYRSSRKIDYQEYQNQYNKKYYMENKEEIAIHGKEYRKRTKKIWKEKWKLKGKTPGTRYCVYKGTAKRRNINFNITIEEFMQFWNRPCDYCGSEIIGIGIDRVDNSKGYDMDNLVSCCAWCNKMKLTYTKEEFINHCKEIIKFTNKKHEI